MISKFIHFHFWFWSTSIFIFYSFHFFVNCPNKTSEWIDAAGWRIFSARFMELSGCDGRAKETRMLLWSDSVDDRTTKWKRKRGEKWSELIAKNRVCPFRGRIFQKKNQDNADHKSISSFLIPTPWRWRTCRGWLRRWPWSLLLGRADKSNEIKLAESLRRRDCRTKIRNSRWRGLGRWLMVRRRCCHRMSATLRKRRHRMVDSCNNNCLIHNNILVLLFLRKWLLWVYRNI